jgi:hypothetical protein
VVINLLPPFKEMVNLILHLVISSKVRLLLKELEEARGTVVSMSYDAEISSDDVSSSSYVISEKLVTFR